MTLRMILVVCAVLLPLVASATHFENIVATGDCDGWELETGISWRPDVSEGELSYEITLMDADGNVVETQSWTGVINRVENPQTYTFGDIWTVTSTSGIYSVAYSVQIITDPQTGIADDTVQGDSGQFSCDTVAAEAQSWSTVKELYR